MVQGLPTFIPATPHGIMLMLEHYKIDTRGMQAVVVGRSNIGRKTHEHFAQQQYQSG